MCLAILGLMMQGCADSVVDADGISVAGPDKTTVQLAPSVSQFSLTLYPMLKARCGACHSSKGAETSLDFASLDINHAHDEVLTVAPGLGSIVDLEKPFSSRVVQKLRTEKHNCWSGNTGCDQDADSLKVKIEAWAKGNGVAFQSEVPKIKSGEILLSTGAALPVSTGDAAGNFKQVTWDLSAAGLTGVTFRVDVQDFSKEAYRFRNPTFLFTGGSVVVKEIFFSVNGKVRINESLFRDINTTVPTPGGTSLITGAQIILKDKGPAEDLIGIQFSTLSKT